MPLKVNMQGVPMGADSVRDLGMYTATFAAYTAKVNAENGSTNVSARFTATSPDEYSGRAIFMNLSTSEKALPFAKQNLAHMGADPDWLEDSEADWEVFLNDQVGREHYLRIAQAKGEYNGLPNINVTVMDPLIAEKLLTQPVPQAPVAAAAASGGKSK